MPDSPNTRHEIFAQELAKGISKTEAYLRAGYKGDRTAASRLSTNVNILRRVRQLQTEAADATAVTIESLTMEIELARKIAIQTRNASAAVSATMAKAKLNGLLDAPRDPVADPNSAPTYSTRDIARRIAYIIYLAELDRQNTPAPIPHE